MMLSNTGWRQSGPAYCYFPEVRSRRNFYYHYVNDIENVMILETTLHKLFGKLMIALEPTDVLNTYNNKT